MSPQVEIQLIAVVVAVACALPGVFLVLRRMAMLSDAISHAILLGIVLAFFATQDLSSPFLIIAAAPTGVLTVSLVEVLNRTRLVKEDAAIGLVFPLLFSIGVILISRYAGKVHLDTDAVLLGELAFAPFDRLVVFGIDIGPKSLYLMGGILMLNLAFIVVFFKELKLATFDAQLAAALGFAPGLIHYGLMTLVSVTAVGAFEAVGSILVVALMIGPPAAAYLITDSIVSMLYLSSGIGFLAAIGGYWTAHLFDVSIAGSMASIVGILFMFSFLFAPHRGMVALARRRAKQRIEFALEMLVVHLLNHQGMPEEEQECHIGHLPAHLHWNAQFIERIVKQGEKEHLLKRVHQFLKLTDEGCKKAEVSLTR